MFEKKKKKKIKKKKKKKSSEKSKRGVVPPSLYAEKLVTWEGDAETEKRCNTATTPAKGRKTQFHMITLHSTASK